MEPLLNQASESARRVRCLFQVGPEFDRFTPAAAWEDARIGLRFMRLFEVHDHHGAIRRVALVTDARLAALAPRIAEHCVKAEVRHFA